MAMRAARSPSHGSGSRNPNMASEGIVCRILAAPITGLAQRGARVSQMPAGTAIAAANSMAAPVSQRCSMRERGDLRRRTAMRKLAHARASVRRSASVCVALAAMEGANVGDDFGLLGAQEFIAAQDLR